MQVLNFIKLFDMYGNRNLLIFLIFSLALYIAVVVMLAMGGMTTTIVNSWCVGWGNHGKGGFG